MEEVLKAAMEENPVGRKVPPVTDPTPEASRKTPAVGDPPPEAERKPGEAARA